MEPSDDAGAGDASGSGGSGEAMRNGTVFEENICSSSLGLKGPQKAWIVFGCFFCDKTHPGDLAWSSPAAGLNKSSKSSGQSQTSRFGGRIPHHDQEGSISTIIVKDVQCFLSTIEQIYFLQSISGSLRGLRGAHPAWKSSSSSSKRPEGS